MAHEKLDGCARDGELGAVCGDGVLATAGELTEVVLIETTSGRVDELEVGRDKRQQGAEKQLDLHRGGVCVV